MLRIGLQTDPFYEIWEGRPTKYDGVKGHQFQSD